MIFISVFSSVLLSIENIFQTLHETAKHLEVCHKYFTTRPIFNSPKSARNTCLINH